MKLCPECHAQLEPWEVACHGCGLATLSEPIRVADVAPAKPELEEAYSSWLRQGCEALIAGNFEEACNCLREAIKRSRALDDAPNKEIEARKHLGDALEKLHKLQEAADQYRIIAQEIKGEELREVWLKRSQDLIAASSPVPYDLLFQSEEFRILADEEGGIVPLYCSGCKRLLAESEVYGFRRGITATVRCWCGIDGKPLAKQDAKHSRAMNEALGYITSQRSRAIEVASQELPGGRRRVTAALLAFTLGFVGAHKFYLGETTAGLIYLLWCWTGIPLLISIYEAVMLCEMSMVNFNMTYNIELVLANTEPPEESRLAKMDVFSAEPGENSDEDSELCSEPAAETK